MIKKFSTPRPNLVLPLRRLGLAAILVAAATLPVAQAAPRPAAPGRLAATPLFHGTAEQCLRILRRTGQESVVNTCASCRQVKVQRDRPGGGFPSYRTYRVPERSHVTLSFRGPGHTRIVADEPCPGAEDTKPAASGEKRCVIPQRLGDGSFRLFNGCEACRAVLVERIDRDGSRHHQLLSIAPKSTVPLDAQGAAQARLVAEKSCQ